MHYLTLEKLKKLDVSDKASFSSKFILKYLQWFNENLQLAI